MKTNGTGFTLVELLVVMAIVAILAMVALVVFNPVEMNRRARDTVRLSDLTILKQAINIENQEVNETQTSGYCFQTQIPCQGTTYPLEASTQNNDGSGWVKVNLSSKKGIRLPVLPIDPRNNQDYNYCYYSDGDSWEVDATLESDQFKDRMQKDGGDNPTKYEVGSDLTLIH
ncbi:MAG: type II secretion system protein [Candidatus Daviesbacteria bacterium]